LLQASTSGIQLVIKDTHRRRDIAHSLTVATAACVASGGLLYLGYLAYTAVVAARSRHHAVDGDHLLVFGKRLRNGRPDEDFARRLRRAHKLAARRPERPLILLGGGCSGISEAQAGLHLLRDMGLPEQVPVWLEDRSQDTLENLRNARAMLSRRGPGAVLLLSNRYHLARCARLAAQLGFDYRLCAAEARFVPSPRALLRLAVEAAFLCWLDIGTRWARLIGHRRMLDRVT
jgi:uncharacterized SAM-binding protein YcdF (DUF218 family)